MGLFYDAKCEGCGLGGGMLCLGTGGSSTSELASQKLFYCPTCEVLQTSAVMRSGAELAALADDASARTRTIAVGEVAQLILDARQHRCEEGHRMRGPIACERGPEVRCPRCSARSLVLKPAGLWD